MSHGVLYLSLKALMIVAIDYLQYTITSRADMPNEKFCEEIERAARDMYTLHSQVKDRKANL